MEAEVFRQIPREELDKRSVVIFHVGNYRKLMTPNLTLSFNFKLSNFVNYRVWSQFRVDLFSTLVWLMVFKFDAGVHFGDP